MKDKELVAGGKNRVLTPEDVMDQARPVVVDLSKSEDDRPLHYRHPDREWRRVRCSVCNLPLGLKRTSPAVKDEATGLLKHTSCPIKVKRRGN